jgi:hypothetical protein
MKTNIFVVSLLALVKTLAVTIGCFLLMILVFNDNLEIFRHEEEVFLYIFLGAFLYSLGCIVYIFSILLPMFYIDRKKIEILSAVELFDRHAPLIAGITTLICGFVFFAAGKESWHSGMLQCNLFNVYVMVFSGLLFFEYQVKSSINKAMPKINPTALA